MTCVCGAEGAAMCRACIEADMDAETERDWEPTDDEIYNTPQYIADNRHENDRSL